jgi:cytochrome c-type biogenesis protein CcmH
MSRSIKLAALGLWTAGLLLLIALTSAVLAQDNVPPTPTPAAKQPVTADDVNHIAKQMYCPVCENEPLDACRTAACQQWRAQIGQMLSDGQSEQQIKDYFVSRYGARVLAQPPAAGTSLLLYVLPIMGLIVGAVIVIWFMRRLRARGTSASSSQPVAATPAQPTGDEYIDRVEKDLKNW